MKLHSMKIRFAAAIALAYIAIALFTCLVFHLVTARVVRHLATDVAIGQAATVISTRDFSPIIATIIVSLLAVILITWLLLNQVVLRPLSRLTESARQIARGDFDIVMPVHSDDEIGELTRSFNHMAAMVKEHTHGLEELVTDRTRRLESANLELQAVNAEITARSSEAEAALEALRRSEDQLRLILDSTAEAIYGIDLDGTCTFCNAACVRLLGYSCADDLVGRNMHGQIHHARKDGSLFPETECPIYLSLRQEEGIHVDDQVFWRADGTSVPVEFWSYPQFRNGGIVGAVVTFLDISERILAEEKVLKLSRAVENSPATVAITDSQGMIEYVNPKFTQTTGYLPEEAIGKNPRILKASVQSDEFYRELWATISSGREWRGEFCNKRKNGEIYWEYASISPLRDESGAITHYIAVKEDITERKRIADELQTAKDAADAANRAKSQFLANMSHEIRTPLNAIIGFSTLALENDLTPQQYDFVSTINTAAVSLLRIINDILDFSKIEAGKLDMEHTLFRLDDTLANVMAVVRQKADEKGLNLRLELSPDLPGHLLGDPFRLSQVVTNLLGNAVKFTEAGEVVVGVVPRERTGTSLMLCFSVRDTGVGLSPESLAKLFRPFTQADGSTTRRFGGTGLGLSISKQLVEMMEGEIWGESEPGRGSTFSFTARFGMAGSDQGQTAGPEAGKGRPLPAAGHGAPESGEGAGGSGLINGLAGVRLLLVDDNGVNRQLACEFLKKTGATIDLATNGREAVEMVARGDRVYDLVLMDAQMPEMDGYEATRRIRADGRFGRLPIIAMTAHALVEEVQKSRDAGMDDHITKPINVRALFGTIRAHLRPPLTAPQQAVPPGREAEEGAIPPIEGLDMANALEHIGGDRVLYLEILEMFVHSHATAATAVAGALADGDHGLAERIAHTTRGAAGSIGASLLQEIAGTLEQAIRRNEPAASLHGIIRQLDDETQRLVRILRKVLPGAADMPDETENGIDRDNAGSVMRRLHRYIRESDGRAVHYLNECRQELAGLPRAEVERLRSAVAGYDYDAALGVLTALSEQMGIVLAGPGGDEPT